MEYRAVEADKLKEILGQQCSPDRGYQGYVIGPDAKGRLCHCSSHRSIGDARRYAKELNKAKAFVKDHIVISHVGG